MIFELLNIVAAASLMAWIGLVIFRGGFWRADQRLGEARDLADWPTVVAVIPARDEAETIGRTVDSLLAQDYAGDFRVIVVDDNSGDGTAAAAGASERLNVITGSPLEPGWTGKLWAVQQGLGAAAEITPNAGYVLLTDADIDHHQSNLRELVYKAETESLDLVSLMVRLRCVSAWERLLIPAFVYFFQKLYPFTWVNDPARSEAAAGGGCMLVRLSALRAAGGIGEIKGRVIDDCALGALLKRGGAIWLGLTEQTRSLRAYDDLSEIWNMVARTAFVQLNHSTLALIGTVIAMFVIYVGPPASMIAALVLGDHLMGFVGGSAMALMAASYGPTLRLYGRPGWDGLRLPVAAVLYTLMTVSSALRHWRGRGGAWKGRSYSQSL